MPCKAGKATLTNSIARTAKVVPWQSSAHLIIKRSSMYMNPTGIYRNASPA